MSYIHYMTREEGLERTKNMLHMFEKGYYKYKDKVVYFGYELDYATRHTFRLDNFTPFVPAKRAGKLTLKEQTTTAAIDEFKSAAHLAVLNFANEMKPGGGFLKGCSAQEEQLCMRSGLYHCLSDPVQHRNYYEINREGSFKNNSLLYSPGVPFILDDNFQPKENVQLVSVITCAAPDLRVFDHKEKERLKKDIDTIIETRIEMVLNVAASCNVTHLVLGGWGCGCFLNDPIFVAKTFKDKLETYLPNFEEVRFAIIDNSENQLVRHAFYNEFHANLI